MNAERSSNPWSLTTTARFNEGDEGGLNLGQILAAIRRKAWLIVALVAGMSALAAFKALTDDPVYTGQFEILVEPETVENQVISSTNPDTIETQESLSDAKDTAIKLKILKSPEVMAPIVKQLQTIYPDMSYGTLASGLDIKTEGESTLIMTVSYQSQDPEQVKAVLDTVSKAYLNYSLDSRQTGIRRGIKFVEDQLPQLQERVSVQQQRLQKIRQQNNLVDPDVKGQQLSASIGSFEQERLKNQIELNQTKAIYASLQSNLTSQNTSNVSSPSLTANARYQGLLDQLLQVDSQMAKDSVLLDEQSPEIRSLRQQRQNLLPLLRQEGQRVAKETASRISEMEARDRILSQAINGLNQDVKRLSSVIRQYNDIQREMQIATENLNQFLSKREALRIDAAQKELPWRLLSPPPEEPDASAVNVTRNLLLGGFLGLILGLGAALATDKLSDLLYTIPEVRDAAKLPILGAIPYEKALEKEERSFSENGTRQLVLLNGNKKSSAFSLSPAFYEAFRFLYTNIRLLKSNPPIQSLIVSSASPEDGKATVALYLAQTAATMGQRVLLVDIDLRYPGLHERLKLPNMPGLSDLLASETLDVNEAIQRSPLDDNLFVLTAGSALSDPTRFLASIKMQELMEKLRSAFDLVIYKASSISEFADPYLLASHTNGILLVAGLGKLKRTVLEQSLEELKISGTTILGVVANGSRTSTSAPRREEVQKERLTR